MNVSLRNIEIILCRIIRLDMKIKRRYLILECLCLCLQGQGGVTVDDCDLTQKFQSDGGESHNVHAED